MAPTALTLNNMLETLEEEDYKIAISFIEYLTDARRKKKAEASKNILAEIQGMFSENKGWDSEDSMIKDLAAFRKERMSL